MDNLSNKHIKTLKDSFKICDHCGIRCLEIKVGLGGLICPDCEKKLQNEHIESDVRENGVIEVAQ